MAAVTEAPPRPKRRPRAATIGAIATAALLVLAGAAFAFTRLTAGSSGLAGGMIVNGSPAAPDFTLTDQNGQQVTLSDYKGKTVALTFLYTHCPDVCPLIATTLGTADRRLGAGQSQLEMLAVSVDPLGDTPPAVLKFDDDRGLSGLANWHYLTGSPAQLEKVWQAYGGIADPGQANKPASPADFGHEAIVYVIDPQGRMRVAMPANFQASDLLANVHALG